VKFVVGIILYFEVSCSAYPVLLLEEGVVKPLLLVLTPNSARETVSSPQLRINSWKSNFVVSLGPVRASLCVHTVECWNWWKGRRFGAFFFNIFLIIYF